MPPRRVVIVGGGASGALVAVQLLRRGGAGLTITVVEPREAVGPGIAFGTADPWHRLNVPAQTMSGLPDDLDHFRRWADVPPASFPPRMLYGRYLRALVAESAATSAARLRHVRDRAARLEVVEDGFTVMTGSGQAIAADAVVIATGNELPVVPAALEPVRDDPRFVRDPWAPRALDAIADGETVAILGTGHTAVDLAASVIVLHPAARVIALSRHGDLPRVHEDPWRPRPPTPVFTVDELRAFREPLREARERIRAHELGWRQGLDSLRPITQAMWAALDDADRAQFLRDWRREWEVHRSRVSADAMRDVRSWIAQGRLVVRAGALEQVIAEGGRLRLVAGADPILADHLLLATGPDERPLANPFLATAIEDGLLRPGPLGLGLDADPDTLRAIEAAGRSPGRVFAIGPVLRGVLWETIAVPEIRDQAARIAVGVLAGT